MKVIVRYYGIVEKEVAVDDKFLKLKNWDVVDPETEALSDELYNIGRIVADGCLGTMTDLVSVVDAESRCVLVES